MAADTPNWTMLGVLLPIATLSDSYRGPIILADETQTVRWFVPKANKQPVDHVEHVRDPELGFLQDDEGEPKTTSRTVKPAYWAMAEIVK